jgi:serine/threonine-protein kinase
MSDTADDSSPQAVYYCPTCEGAFIAGGACPTDGTKLIHLDGRFDPFLGRTLDDKYTILAKLGQGGMGAVYRAEQRGLGREVAIKVVHAHRLSEPETIKRFLREAKLASRLSHPHAVGVIDFGQTDDGVCYLVMELVTGRTLDQVLDTEGVFPPERLVRIGAQICDALDRAHAMQIVHRDLKPSNAMLLAQERDFVKILDFGLAKSVGAGEVTSVTATGTVLGTPAYISPELVLGQPCDGRADLYSLGVLLYLLGSGRLPFQASSPHELVSLHGTVPAPAMTGVPPALAGVIDRLLRKSPADRYPTAAATREALERALTADRAAAPTGSARRRRAPVLAGALFGAGIAGLAGYLVLASGSPPAGSSTPPATAPPPAPAIVTLLPPDAAPAPAPVPVPADASLEVAAPPEAGLSQPTRPTKVRARAPASSAKKAAKGTSTGSRSPRPAPSERQPVRPVPPKQPGPGPAAGAGAGTRDGLPF